MTINIMRMNRIIKIFKTCKTDNLCYVALAKDANLLYTQTLWLKRKLNKDEIYEYNQWMEQLMKKENYDSSVIWDHSSINQDS
jgi:hypothetical protein